MFARSPNHGNPSNVRVEATRTPSRTILHSQSSPIRNPATLSSGLPALWPFPRVAHTGHVRQMTEEDEVKALADALQHEFSDVATSIEDVRHEVRDARERYINARVRQYVPVLVYRRARESLRRRRTTGSCLTFGS